VLVFKVEITISNKKYEMKNLKTLLAVPAIILFSLINSPEVFAQEPEKPAKTSGCKPSSCRGEKTKFGEAKVITEAREDLVALKAEMEKSASPIFNERSFDIHNIVGESDEESIAIIAREVKIIESEMSEKFKHEFSAFELPDNKAQQVKYLSGRIQDLQKLL